MEKGELEGIQGILQDAGIEVDIKTLQNPTEEFMTYLIIEYFNKFHFNGNEIAMATPEQLDSISSEESASNMVKAINLYSALASFRDKIFLTDFTLTDIISPGNKKAGKRIKVLFNFFVYVRNKKMEKEPIFCELEQKRREFEDMINEKAELTAKIGSTINDRECKLEYKEKLKQEIEECTLQLKKDEKSSDKLQKSIEKVSAVHQEGLNKLNALKAKAHELHKVIKDLESKIVKSPEEFLAKSKELKIEIDGKQVERQNLQVQINNFKNQLRKNELAETFVKTWHEKIASVGEIVQQLKEAILQINSTKNQLHELKQEISKYERNSSGQISDSSSIESSDLEQNERVLSELHRALAEKQREYEKLMVKIEMLQNEKATIKNHLKKEVESISKAERNFIALLGDLKLHYDDVMLEEINFRKIFRQLPS